MLLYLYPSHRKDMNIYRNQITRIPKTIDPKPLPQNTQDTSLKHSLIYKNIKNKDM